MLELGVVGGQTGDPLGRAARPVRRPGGGRGGEARRVVARLVEVVRINLAQQALWPRPIPMHVCHFLLKVLYLLFFIRPSLLFRDRDRACFRFFRGLPPSPPSCFGLLSLACACGDVGVSRMFCGGSVVRRV